MLFGDRDEFGVEFEIDSDCGGEWMFGRLCYWIDGNQVGDYELGTSLRDALFQMKYVLHFAGARQGGQLCNIAAIDFFNLIDGVLFAGNVAEQSELLDLVPDDCARFHVAPTVDVFDQWKVFLLDCGKFETLIYRHLSSEEIQLKRLPSGKFDEIVGAFSAELEFRYNRLINSD